MFVAVSCLQAVLITLYLTPYRYFQVKWHTNNKYILFTFTNQRLLEPFYVYVIEQTNKLTNKHKKGFENNCMMHNGGESRKLYQ